MGTFTKSPISLRMERRATLPIQLSPISEYTQKQNERSKRQSDESDELQADPAHPAPVQGSDGGRAQDEAAGEEGGETGAP